MSAPFRVADWAFDPSTGEAKRGTHTVHLEPRVMAVLVALAHHAGQVVSKEALRREVWRGVVVTDDALTRCISVLRHLLGDDAQHPRFIETIPKCGYRLIAGVARNAHSRRGIAILPLVDNTADSTKAFVAPAITELLTSELGMVADCRVLSRSSVEHLVREAQPASELAQQLDADLLVEGSVFRAGSGVGLSVRVISAQDESLLWGASYSFKLADLMTSCMEIGRAIATEVHVARGPVRSPSPGQAAPEQAVLRYLEGRHLVTRRDVKALGRAIDRFGEALTLCPGLLLAHLGIADAAIMLAIYGAEPPGHCVARARQHVEDARAIDPSAAEIVVVDAGLALFFDWDLTTAQRLLDEAAKRAPNNAFVHLGRSTLHAIYGRHDEALGSMRQAHALAPFDPGMRMNYGERLFAAGRHEEALSHFRRILASEPGFVPARMRLARALSLLERHVEATQALSLLPQPGGSQMLATRAVVLARALRLRAARETARRLSELAEAEYVGACRLAQVAVALGDEDEAMEHLRRAVEERDPQALFVGVDPLLAPLSPRDDFRGLIDAIGVS